MILPSKYVEYKKSYIYYSDLIIETIIAKNGGKSIEIIWNVFHKKHKEISFNSFYNSILLLFMLGLVEVDERGELREIKKIGNN